MDFLSFDFDERIMEGIDAMNYKAPTPIQQEVIPEILQGSDLIACAQTGTGKTAAFLLPMLHKIITRPAGDHIKGLIIVPTRELAIQIAQQLEGFSYFSNVSSLAVFGGGDGATYSNEKRAMSQGVDIVVCTPGRMISHLNMGYVKMDKLQYLVLDEADRMLDMGFFDDIMKIISYIPNKRQSLLFSATMPPKIRDMARKILQKPKEINIAAATPPEKIRQEAYVVYENQKVPLVKDLVHKDKDLKTIVIFCDTKSMVKQLSRDLKKTIRLVEEIHSDLEQAERESVMNRFKSRQTRVLVATDIISRGIDVEDIDLVINFNVPQDAEDYVHRIGRTARAQADGKACTLIGEKEQRRFAAIERFLGREVEKVTLSEKLGKGPEYQPEKQPSFRGHKPHHNQKFNQRRQQGRGQRSTGNGQRSSNKPVS
ncbi:MAG: DEAD/DEAH box helicase [Bacteroides sp.]|nr:DEAD/DEAH box helicase [Bacteroides sp.]